MHTEDSADDEETRTQYDIEEHSQSEHLTEENLKKSKDTASKRVPTNNLRETAKTYPKVSYPKGTGGRNPNFKKDLLVFENRKPSYCPLERSRILGAEEIIGPVLGRPPTGKCVEDDLEDFSREHLDEVSPLNGNLTVQRERAPLDDCVLQTMINHSILKRVVRDIKNDTPVKKQPNETQRTLLAKELPLQTTFEDQCRKNGMTIPEGLKYLNNAVKDKDAHNLRKGFWEGFKFKRVRSMQERKSKTEDRRLWRMRARQMARDHKLACHVDEAENFKGGEDTPMNSIPDLDVSNINQARAGTVPQIETRTEDNSYSSKGRFELLRIVEDDEPTSELDTVVPAEHRRIADILNSRGLLSKDELVARRKNRQSNNKCRDNCRQHRKEARKTATPRYQRPTDTSSIDESITQYNCGLNITPKSRIDRPRQLLLSKRNGDIGPSWREEGNHLNILSETRLWRYGISVLKDHNKKTPLALVDQDGVEFPFSFVNDKFVIPVGRHTSHGLERANFILDGGSHVHVVGEADCLRLGAASGNSVCTIGSYSNGSKHELVGGDDWYVALRNRDGHWVAPSTRIVPVSEGSVTNEDLRNLLIESATCLSSRLLVQTRSRKDGKDSTDLHRPEIRTPNDDDKAEGCSEKDTTEILPTTDPSPRTPDELDIKEIEETVADAAIKSLRKQAAHDFVLPKVTPTGHGGSLKRSPEVDLAFRLNASRQRMETLGLSVDNFNKMVKEGYFPDAIELNSDTISNTIDKDIAGGKKKGRVSSPKKLSQKERVELEPFHLVMVDGFEGFDEVDGHDSGHRYLLRFVCASTGHRKSYSCLNKNRFAECLRMYLAWVECIAPIVEAKRQLPKGQIRVRVLCSDRDSNMTTIHGKHRTEFDQELCKKAIHRYFADVGDSNTAGAVESTFYPSARQVNEVMLSRGTPERFAHKCWADCEDKFNCCMTRSNWLGNGEPPNVTLGLDASTDKFKPFGCIGTVNVERKGLYLHPNGSVVNKPPPGRIGDGVGGKVSRIKTLPCIYLRAGGGLTTTAFNGVDFGGYLVYCPALDNPDFAGRGIVATRDVTFHPKLKPERDPLSMIPKKIDKDGGILIPDGTNVRIDFCAMRKVKVLDPDEIKRYERELFSEESLAECGVVSSLNHDMSFARFEADHRNHHEKNSTIDACTQTVNPSLETAAKRVENDDGGVPNQGHSTVVGDSFSGQRAFELEPHGTGTATTHGIVAGRKVKLMKEADAKRSVNQALRNPHVRFHFDQDHEKGGKSKDRYRKYSKECRTLSDFRRLNGTRMPNSKETVVKMADLFFDYRRGTLTFSFGDGTNESNIDEATRLPTHRSLFIADEKSDVTHCIATLGFSDKTEGNIMYDLWKQSGDLGISPRQLQMLSTMKFVLFTSPVSQKDKKVEVKTLREAMKSPDWPLWLESIKKEIEGLEKRGVWDEIHRSQVPKGHSVLPSHLVFKVKYRADGSFDKFKSRLVCGGHRAIEGVHYYNSSSHMVTSTSMRMLMGYSTGDWGRQVEDLVQKGTSRQEALRISECLKVHSIDISQAYIVATVPEGDPTIYMELPNLNPNKAKNQFVARMKRLLYGIPSAGRNFERYLDRFLRSLGARPMVADRSVYTIQMPSGVCTCSCFVDDLSFFASTNEAIDEFISCIRERFGDRDVGWTGGGVADSLLGLQIQYNDDDLSVCVSQPGYIESIAERFGVNNVMRTPKTPLPVSHEDSPYDGVLDLDRQRLFQQIVGCMTWCTHQTRPEAMIATSILSQHCKNPGDDHVALALHTLKYLYGTRERGIVFHGSKRALSQRMDVRHKIWAMVDANLGGDAFSERSRSCFVIMLNGGPVAFKVMKQTSVSRSTGHAEMQALAQLTQYLQFCTDLGSELGYHTGCVRVLEDNSSVCLHAGGDHQAMKSGHYRRDQAYVDEVVNAGKIFVDKVESKFNTADLGTKAVKPIELFEFLRDRMTGYDTTEYISPRVNTTLERRSVRRTSGNDECLNKSTDSIKLSTHGTCGTKKGALESEIFTKHAKDRTSDAARDHTSILGI